MIENNHFKNFLFIGLSIIAYTIVEIVRKSTYDVTNMFVNLLLSVIIIALYTYVSTTINPLIQKPTLLSVSKDSKVGYIQKAKRFIVVHKPIIIPIAIVYGFIIDKFTDNTGESIAQTQSIASLKGMTIYESILKTGIKTPILEEVLDRGLMYFIIITLMTYILKALLGKGKSKIIYLLSSVIYILLSSFLFALGHVTKIHWYIPTEWNAYPIQWEYISTYIIAGIIYSMIFIVFSNKLKAIMITILLHVGNNISSIIMIKYEVNNIACIIIFAVVIAIISVLITCSKDDFKRAIEGNKKE